MPFAETRPTVNECLTRTRPGGFARTAPPRGDAVTRTSVLLELLNRAPGLPPGAGTCAEDWWRGARSGGEELVAFLIRQGVLSETATIVLDLVVEGTIPAAPIRLVLPGAPAVLARHLVARLARLEDTPPPPTQFIGREHSDGIETVFLPPSAPPPHTDNLTPAPPRSLLPESFMRPPPDDAPPNPLPPARLTLAPRPVPTPPPLLLTPADDRQASAARKG